MDRRVFMAMTGSASLGLAVGAGAAEGEKKPFEVRRLGDGPIIHVDLDPVLTEEAASYGYVNINGPSLIRAPEWVEKPLGRYYLYFAHHKGPQIRLAYADELAGPWKLHPADALRLADSGFPVETASDSGVLSAGANLFKTFPPAVAWAMVRVGLDALSAVDEREAEGIKGSKETRPHIASPDAMVDHEARQVRLYYHGMTADGGQMSRVAVSDDGVNFRDPSPLLTSPYLRMFRYRGIHYGLSMPGLMNRSQDGLSDFEIRSRLLFGANMRHSALLIRGETLYVFHSRVGDAPERILLSTIDLSPEDWNDWEATEPVEIMRPEQPWEGADQPVKPSIRGEITRPVNQLRDPAVFEDDGKVYLLYAGAGEQSIGIAELRAK